MNRLDQLITTFDLGLRTVFASPHARRPCPGAGPEADLGEAERAKAAALMRVNHVGEVCAQALYAGQALTAKNETVRADDENAALLKLRQGLPRGTYETPLSHATHLGTPWPQFEPSRD